MAQSLLTKESPEIRQFFPDHWHIVPPSGHTGGKVPSATERRPLHDGQRTCRKTETDTKDTGGLPPERKNTLLQDRRQIIVQGERCPGIAGNQPDGSVRLNPAPRLSTGRFFFSMADRTWHLCPDRLSDFLTMSAVHAACTWIVHECRRTSLPYNFLQDHSYRISILTCKGRLLPSIGQGGPPDWLEGKNHPRFAPVFFPSKPCAITAKTQTGAYKK